MEVSRRTLLLAAGAGLGAAATSLFGGVWLRDVLNDDPPVDGEAFLDEPGIYQQPVEAVNGDVAGERLPETPLLTVDDTEVRLTERLGNPMVVNLWFANCPPCRRELSDFAAVHAEVGDRIEFIGIDPFDTVDAMLRFASARGVEYELLRDPSREFTAAVEVVAFPVTLFVDVDGRILRQTGEIDAAELRATIGELFGV